MLGLLGSWRVVHWRASAAPLGKPELQDLRVQPTPSNGSILPEQNHYACRVRRGTQVAAEVKPAEKIGLALFLVTVGSTHYKVPTESESFNKEISLSRCY